MRNKRRRPRSTRRASQVAPARGTLRLGLVLTLLVSVNLYVFLWRGDTSIPAVMEQAAMAGHKGVLGPKTEAAASAEAALRETLAEFDEMAAEPSAARVIDGTVQSGDSMGGILRREGMGAADADELVKAVSEHMDLNRIRPGEAYQIRLDGAGELAAFEYALSRTTSVRAERDQRGELVAHIEEAATEVRVEEIGGHIESSLYASIKDAGENSALVAFFADVFAYDVNFFTETKAGDTFRMVVEKEYLNGSFLRYRRVLAAEYSGKVGTFHAFWWQAPGADEGGYYDADGRSVERSLLKTPLKFARISSKFNPKRMHPVLHKVRAHMGVDYAAPTGTPVWSAASGRIVYRGKRGGAGNCVIIQHDNGLQTVYMHLSKFEDGQRVGAHIKSKTVIGYVGSTGLATGPHLHFGVKQNGRYIDPLTLKMSRGPLLPRKFRDRFKAEAERLSAQLARIATDSEA